MMAVKPPERVLTVKDVAHHLGISDWTVYNLVAGGHIRAGHVGRLIRIPESALSEFISAISYREEEPK